MRHPPTPTAAPEVEQMKARCRAKHRQRIADAREEALLCREQYDEQLAEHGDIGRELHGDLAVAALKYDSQIHVYRDEDIVDGIYPDIRPLRKKMFEFDGHVADLPGVSAKVWAAHIDALDAAAWKLGFTGGDNQ
jgi:hypothetical protein